MSTIVFSDKDKKNSGDYRRRKVNEFKNRILDFLTQTSDKTDRFEWVWMMKTLQSNDLLPNKNEKFYYAKKEGRFLVIDIEKPDKLVYSPETLPKDRKKFNELFLAESQAFLRKLDNEWAQEVKPMQKLLDEIIADPLLDQKTKNDLEDFYDTNFLGNRDELPSVLKEVNDYIKTLQNNIGTGKLTIVKNQNESLNKNDFLVKKLDLSEGSSDLVRPNAQKDKEMHDTYKPPRPGG